MKMEELAKTKIDNTLQSAVYSVGSVNAIEYLLEYKDPGVLFSNNN
jgi:hypothetical protein